MSSTAPKPNPPRVLALVVAFIVIVALLANLFSTNQEVIQEIPYSEFEELLINPPSEQDKFVEGTFQHNFLIAMRGDRSKVRTYVPNETDHRQILRQHGLKLSFEPDDSDSLWKGLMMQMIPVLLVIVVIVMFMRSIQAGGGKAMSFGKSRAKMVNELKPKVTFADIAGIDEAKWELQEIIDFLKEPKKFTRLGGRIPTGVILVGSPGTGKTILAKGVAGEAGVPFFSISGSDFVEMFVGVGASRVRDLFEQAKKNSPCIVFIDEIDAVGRHRGAGMGGGHDEREQTLNQLLVEMDGFEANEGVIVVAATNRVDVLDPALLRPGRFDRRVHVPTPDIKGRLGILHVHSKKTPLHDDVDLALIAQATPGFTGADLENLINEAALIAARTNSSDVNMMHCEKARDKVIMGAERRSMIMGEAEKRNTAYHEAGHALCGLMTEGADPVHKVTIIPRGQALGVTMMLPKEDRVSISKEYAEARIVYAMGGRAAEELIFDARTSGAEDDLKQATDIARRMICQWGMSDRIGPIAVGQNEREVFVGRGSNGGHDIHSESVAEQIDSEIQRLTQEGYDRALGILRDNRDKLEAIAEALLIKETLSSEEMARVMDGENIVTEEEVQAYKQRIEDAKNWSKDLVDVLPDEQHDAQGSATNVSVVDPKPEVEPSMPA
ncbi:MAG: ATP-dependent zinc metalloprotease FtsH [Zetaproteobacteria bacterium]|nr:ATP-dependent zinc metalloprotease FtsH [Zetaproteobacteria bacterium]